ncbi:hypothetical protein DDI_0919 [Dickeya dianthicola RNS04.9]|nr:hypothetical protein DDI_0919 [Dickeya dianthicola RNS04.9]
MGRLHLPVSLTRFERFRARAATVFFIADACGRHGEGPLAVFSEYQVLSGTTL